MEKIKYNFPIGTKIKLTLNHSWYICPMIEDAAGNKNKSGTLTQDQSSYYDGIIEKYIDDRFIHIKILSDDNDWCIIEVLNGEPVILKEVK